MSVSSVAGAYPRNWTPIENRRDDAAQQTVASNTSSPDEGSTPAPFAYLRSPTDSIQVSLPNGMSVGIFHFGAGSSGFDAQMLQSLEDLVSNLSAYTPPSKGTVDETQPGTVGDSSKLAGSNGDMQGMQAIDMIHVDLPNGIAIEARHGSARGDADGGLAAMKEMEKEIQELVGHFSNVGNGSTITTSTRAGASANQQRSTAYAEQAKQASLAAGLGLSRES